jgi:hypothetical protein
VATASPAKPTILFSPIFPVQVGISTRLHPLGFARHLGSAEPFSVVLTS